DQGWFGCDVSPVSVRPASDGITRRITGETTSRITHEILLLVETQDDRAAFLWRNILQSVADILVAEPAEVWTVENYRVSDMPVYWRVVGFDAPTKDIRVCDRSERTAVKWVR